MFLPRKITFYISRKIQIKVTYVDPTSMYYTTTLLYLYSILRGEKEMLPANEAYSSPILPSTYIYYPMLWAKGIVYIGKNVRESSNKQPTPYVLLLLLVQFACISFILLLCSPAENECNCVLNPFVGNEGHLGTPSCWPPKVCNFQSYQFFPHSSNK